MLKKSILSTAILFTILDYPVYAGQQTFLWTGNSNLQWDTSANWLIEVFTPPIHPAPIAGDIVIFSGNTPGTNTQNVPTVTISPLLALNATGGTYTWVGNDCDISQINCTSTGPFNLGFNLPIPSTAVLPINLSGGAQLQISSIISGVGSSVAIAAGAGGGQLTLSGANTYSGGTTVGTGIALKTFPVSLSGSVNNSGSITFFSDVGGSTSASIVGTGNVTFTFETIPRAVTVTAASNYQGATVIDAPAANALVPNASNLLAILSDYTVNGTLNASGTAQNIGSLSGTGSLEILGSLNFTTGNNGNSSTFSGVISGLGGVLAKTGVGVFTLTGANTYGGAGGGTLLSNGTIVISSDGNLGDPTGFLHFSSSSGTLELTNSSPIVSARPISMTAVGATAIFQTDTSTTTLSGTISDVGGGMLLKTMPGTLILTGTNTYTGTTTVNGGTLAITNDSNIGSGTAALLLNNGTTLQANGASTLASHPVTLTSSTTIDTNGSTFTISTALSGTGSLTKIGTNILTLSHSNSYGGSTTVNGGTFRAGAAGAFPSTSDFTIATGTLDLNNISQTINSLSGNSGTLVTLGTATLTTGAAGNTTYAGTISGSGSLIKQGTGVFTLTGTSTYTGTTTVSQGTLTVNGAIADATALTVAHGATLKGTGTVAGVGSISGTVQPGNSIGTLTLAGNQTFLPNSTYSTEVSAPASSLLIINPGNLTIDASTTLQVTVDPGVYTTGTVYPIIETPAGTISGTFPTVNFSSNMVLFDTQYLANQLNLIVQGFVPFITVSPNGNAGQVAKCLDAAHATGDLANVIGQLQFSSDSIIQKALNAIAAPVYTDLALAQQNNTFRVRSSISSHMKHLYQRSCSRLKRGKIASNLWADVYGDWVSEGGKKNKPGFNATTGGALIGYDYTFWKEFFIGASAAYTYSDFDWHKHRGHGHINSYYGTFYLGYHKNWFYTNAMIMGAYNDYEAHRKIKFPAINRTAKSTPQGAELAVYGDVGFLFEPAKHFELGPFISLDYIHLHQKSFRESGAQGLNLKIREKNADVLRSEIGVQGSYCYLQDDYIVKPWAKLSYVRESRFEGMHENASFVGQSCNMHFTGLYPDRNIFAPAASITFYFSNNKFSLGAWYEGEIGHDYSDNRVHLQFNYTF